MGGGGGDSIFTGRTGQEIIFLSCVHYTALQKCCSVFVVVQFGSFPLLSGTARKIGSFFSLSH